MRNLSIVITVRERYGYTRECLEALLPQLPPSVPVVFAGGAVPGPVLSYLKRKARERRGFSLIARNEFLFGNDARIAALAKVPRKSDLVFLENDVVPQKGFLPPLLRCAKQEKAGIVSPLILEGVPSSGKYLVHITGLRAVREAGPGSPVRELRFIENHAPPGTKLEREAFDAVESHCFLVRRSLLDRVPLTPGLDAMFAHLDLCFRAGALGERILLEPSSRVVFANPKLAPLRHKEDLETFLTAWGQRRWRVQEEDFCRSWGFSPKSLIVWGHQEWSLINKKDIFMTFGVLNLWDRLLLRASRFKACPGPLRGALEDLVSSKVRRKAAWEPWPV